LINPQNANVPSVVANATHGLRRTNQDKRRAVELLLNDPEWSGWSDHEIARACGVTQPFVSKLRNSLFTANSDNTQTTRYYTNKHGDISAMDVGGLRARGAAGDSVSVAPLLGASAAAFGGSLPDI